MSTKGYPTELRTFLRGEFALLPGSNPSRPAPAHILNRFLYALLGTGTARKGLQAARFSPTPTQLDALLGGRPQPEHRDDLRITLSAVLDADRRTFAEFASYFPVHAGFVGADASDDHFGQGLVLMLTEQQRLLLRKQLTSLLNASPGDGDVVTNFAATVASLLSEGTPEADQDLPLLKEPGTKTTRLGDGLFDLVSRRIDTILSGHLGADRVRFLQRLSDFLAAFVCLALLYEGAFREAKQTLGDDISTRLASDGVGAVLGIPVYCGPPPGSQHEMSVELSRRCLNDAVRRAHRGIGGAFLNLIPKTDSALESLVVSVAGGTEATSVLRVLREQDVLNNPEAAFPRLLSESQLHKSVKLLGTKVGMVAPRRGSGASRIVLETTFIDALAYFVGEDGMRFEDFVEECYQRLGLLVGVPESMSPAVYDRLVSLAGQTVDVIPVLAQSAELCRKRLINCGLAQEFSDHATVLRLT